MQKTILILVLFFSLNAFSQSQSTANYSSVNRNYLFSVQRKLLRMQDSLSGPSKIDFNIYNTFEQVDSRSLKPSEYSIAINKISDSLHKTILKAKSPFIDDFYSKMNSMDQLDSSAVYDLLSTADYNLFYGRHLLRTVAKQKPEFLIRYLDKKPENKSKLLYTIRHSRYLNEITENIKKAPLPTKGRKDILKQKRKHALQNFGAGAAYIGIIVAEISLLTLLVTWLLNA